MTVTHEEHLGECNVAADTATYLKTFSNKEFSSKLSSGCLLVIIAYVIARLLP